MPMTHTHTYVELEISLAAYKEIRAKLWAAEYGHCFVVGDEDEHGTGPIDMSGIAVIPAPYTRCSQCGSVIHEVSPGRYECKCEPAHG